MSITETVVEIVQRAPRSGIHHHNELHVEPDVFMALTEEAKAFFKRKGLESDISRDLLKGKFRFMGMPLIEDPSAIFAEVRIAPDKPDKPRVWDKVAAWLEEHA